MSETFFNVFQLSGGYQVLKIVMRKTSIRNVKKTFNAFVVSPEGKKGKHSIEILSKHLIYVKVAFNKNSFLSNVIIIISILIIMIIPKISYGNKIVKENKN